MTTVLDAGTSGAGMARDLDLVRIQRRTMLVLALVQVVGTVGVGVAPTIGVLLADAVTHHEAMAGLARTASTLGAAVFGVPLGVLAARRGRRVALATGWWTAAVGAALLVAAAQWSWAVPLFLGLALVGAGSAVSLQARFAATDLAEPQHRARSLALVVWVGTVGSVLGPNMGVPGAIVARATGLTVFAASFLVAAAFLALAGSCALLLLRPDPLLVAQRRAATPAAPARPVRLPLRARLAGTVDLVRTIAPVRLAVLAILTAQVVMVSVMTMTPVHIVHHGGSIGVVGLTISLHVLGMFALAPLVGATSDRFGHRPTMAAGVALLLASLATGVLRGADMGWVMVSLVLLGLGWSFVNVTASALFSGAVPVESRAASQGGLDALSNLCAATAAFAAGPVLAATSFATLCLLALGLLVPLIAALLLGSRSGRAAA